MMLFMLLMLINIEIYCNWALTAEHVKSVLLTGSIKTYCDMKCGSAKHTLCDPDPEPAPGCWKFLYFDMDEYMEATWNGHNGMRNRAARKYNISNMKRLEWDMELANMAKHWLMKCPKYEKDPCTDLPRNTDLSYTLVNQNYAFLQSRYLPEHFYPTMIRKWYTEKWSIDNPEIDGLGNARFSKLNNYTQMVWATTGRIGCAAGRYANGYGLICNYHAMLSPTQPAWRVGRPCSHCPRNLPRCSSYFDSLCTADKAHSVNVSLIFIKLIMAFYGFVLITNVRYV